MCLQRPMRLVPRYEPHLAAIRGVAARRPRGLHSVYHCRRSGCGNFLRHSRAASGRRRGPYRIGRSDRKSTRLNSSHSQISYAVFCLKKKVSIAREYRQSGADVLDLIQEGNVGLMQAIRKFDPSKGVRFYAYAAWWVRAYILRYLLNNYRLVKIGTTQDQRKLFYNLNKEKRNLERQGFVTDSKLLADRLHVREREVVEMEQRLGSWDVSLDAPLGPDNQETLMEVLPSQHTPADEHLAEEQLRDLFRQKLALFAATLDDRYADILRNRILSENPMTLDDIGRKYNISRERARQLEEKIIKRLREHMKKEVKDFDLLKPSR